MSNATHYATMPASLPGPIGKLIAKRLESAVYQCESLTAWEDLYMYIITDPKWEYDDKIPLKWRERIIEYFLDACKQGELDEEVIDSHASALKSGDGLKERSASEPTTKDCDFSDETSNAGTVRASEIQQAHVSASETQTQAKQELIDSCRICPILNIRSTIIDPRGSSSSRDPKVVMA